MTEVQKFSKKLNIIEAVQWDGGNFAELQGFAVGKVDLFVEHEHGFDSFNLTLLAGKDGAQGWVPVPIGHWLVRNPGDETDYWPVEDAFFENNYDLETAWSPIGSRESIRLAEDLVRFYVNSGHSFTPQEALACLGLINVHINLARYYLDAGF